MHSFHKSNKCGNKKYFLKKNISQFRAVFAMAEGNQDSANVGFSVNEMCGLLCKNGDST